MNWLDIKTSFYKCPADNTGAVASFREILFSRFGIEHEWYFKHHESNKWISGISNDLDSIIDLRTREMCKAERIMLKQTLQCYTPAALLKSKKQGKVEVVNKTGIMQLDWDEPAIIDYDIDELKKAVSNLPFIGFCGLSCSGKGFFALALIAEPDRLCEYAEHVFKIFNYYGIPVDTSKGRNVNDLRYVSYDSNMLYRENPEPLLIKRFQPKPAPKKVFVSNYNQNSYRPNNGLIKASLRKIQSAVTGQRWETVQQVAYTLGGLGNQNIIEDLKNEISSNHEFFGEENKYHKCAEDCFTAGFNNPLKNIK